MTDHTPNPTIRVVNVTPAIAKAWLKHNTNNRNLSHITVSRYANDMAECRWEFAADPIRFDDNGALIDGQHRLHAIAAQPAGFSIPMLVVTKLATSAQMVMDQPKVRTSGDQLALVGIRDTNVVAAGIKLYLTHKMGMLFRDNKAANATITKALIVEWAQGNIGIVEAASSVPKLRASDSPPSVSYCFALMAVQEYGVEWTTEFFRLLAEGAGAGHPINTLDKRLQRTRRERIKAPQRDILAWFLMAANAWEEGRRIHKFQAPRGGKWTEESYPTLGRTAA